MLRLSTAMAARGHEVAVFTSNLSRNGHIEPAAETIQGVSVRRFQTWFRLGTFASFWPEFGGELGTRGFDVIHAHSYRHPHCELAAWWRAPATTKLILDPHWPAYPRGRVGGALATAYDRALGKRLLGRADLVLCATPLEVPWLRTMGAKNIRVVPHGIPATHLGEPNGQAAWRSGPDEFVLVSVGRIEESKGFQFVVDALREVDGVRYLIAGPRGPFYPQLLKTIAAGHLEHRVILLGEISEQEKLALIDAADAFIQPSLFEAYGISTLEALARGRPCLGSNAGGLPWLLSDCGLVFEVGNVKEIARHLRRLRDDADLRKALGETGRQKASRLTWDRIVPEYERVLLELVGS